MLHRALSRFSFLAATRLVVEPPKMLFNLPSRTLLINHTWPACSGLTRFAQDDMQHAVAMPGLVYMQKRYKKKGGKKGRSKASVEEEEEEEESDDDDEEAIDELLDSHVSTTTTISMRLDALGKTCFGVSRSKFDEYFYAGLVRINGERVGKKSYEVTENDEIDLIRGFNLQNREQLDVNRVNVLKVDDKASSSGRLKITYRKTNKLTIANYERDPYDGSVISSGN